MVVVVEGEVVARGIYLALWIARHFVKSERIWFDDDGGAPIIKLSYLPVAPY